MDALMRARDVAARHAHAEASAQRSCTGVSAESNTADLLAAQELRFQAHRERANATAANYDDRANQQSLPPTDLHRRAPSPAIATAVNQSLASDTASHAMHPLGEGRVACPPRQISACALFSILLNVAAFGVAIAVGAKQLWDNGAPHFGPHH
eukprot:2166978-Pleurochrysis_carterae.AAC.1